MQAAWAYFGGPPAAPAPSAAWTSPPAEAAGDSAPDGAPLTSQSTVMQPTGEAQQLLVAVRSGTTVATPWSMADQITALLIARRLGYIDARTFDRRFTRMVSFLGQMQLTADGMPNRFYDVSTGAALDGSLQPGVAGWSAVDTGRLLLWLRIAAEEHPQFAPFIRRAVARLSVCRIISERGQLQLGTAGGEGIQLSPESGRGYDAYAAQGYRAWGIEVPVPAVAESYPFQTEIGGVRFAVSEDTTNQAPVMSTPPAYLGFELGFEPLGQSVDEVAGGRSAVDAMAAVAEAQAARYAESGKPTGRSDFRRGEDPTTVFGTVLAQGYPWSVSAPDGTLRAELPLVTTRAAFALNTFAEDPNAQLLLMLVEELFDPSSGWFEGRYEATGAYEETRTSATNAFVMEALAYRHLGPLYPDAARPRDLQPLAMTRDGTCRLPLSLTAGTP